LGVGIGSVKLNPHTIKALKLRQQRGIFIVSVASGSAPSANLFRKGDVILTIDSRKAEYDGEFREYIQSRRPGETVTLKVLRQRKVLDMRAILGTY
jgi:S1-C subfamily serine protease